MVADWLQANADHVVGDAKLRDFLDPQFPNWSAYCVSLFFFLSVSVWPKNETNMRFVRITFGLRDLSTGETTCLCWPRQKSSGAAS